MTASTTNNFATQLEPAPLQHIWEDDFGSFVLGRTSLLEFLMPGWAGAEFSRPEPPLTIAEDCQPATGHRKILRIYATVMKDEGPAEVVSRRQAAITEWAILMSLDLQA